RVEILAENRLEEGQFAQQFRRADDQGRRHGDAKLRARAAEHDNGENGRAFGEGETRRRNESLPQGEETAGDSGEKSPEREGGELDIGGVEAERAASDLILAQRFPSAAQGQAPQAPRD